MQKNMTDRTPGSYDDFVAYLGTVRTEEELFSRLTYWFAGQDRPEDVLSRSELVEARAKELGFWQGLTFRMERWLADGKSELEAVGREEFQSRIAEDYAAYREKADAARARFRDRRRAAPFNFTPDCLENVPIQNVSWLVDGLLPMGEVSLLGADGAPARASGRPSSLRMSRRAGPPASSPSRRRRPAASSFFPARTTPARCSKPA